MNFHTHYKLISFDFLVIANMDSQPVPRHSDKLLEDLPKIVQNYNEAMMS